MRFRADFHIHSDKNINKNSRRRHGERPDLIAKALHGSSLDVAAVLEHDKISANHLDVQEELAALNTADETARGVEKQILILLGCESRIVYEHFSYHLGHVFELPYRRNNLPPAPTVDCSIEEIEKYRLEYPGITILFHPAWRDHKRNSHDATTSLIKSGVIDGVELLNGMIFDNIRRYSNGRQAGEVNKWFRNFEFALHAYKIGQRELAIHGVNLAPIGCSDAHNAKMIGTMYTEFHARRREDVFKEVRNAKTYAVCAVNGQVRARVRSLSHNGAGKYIKILRNPEKIS